MSLKRKASALERLASCLSTPVTSDFTIYCGRCKFKVHRIIIESASAYFKTACRGGFKEEAESSITLHEDNPEDVARMIIFMYAADFSTKLEGIVSPVIPTAQQILDVAGYTMKPKPEIHGRVTLARAYQLADKYDVFAWKDQCISKYSRSLEDRFAHMKMDNRISYVRSIPIIYSTTPQTDRGLRWLAARFAWQNLHSLLRFPEFAKVFQQEGEFAWDVMCWSSYRKRMSCSICYLEKPIRPGECGKHHICDGLNCDAWLLENLSCEGAKCPQRGRKGRMVLLDRNVDDALDQECRECDEDFGSDWDGEGAGRMSDG